MKNLVKYIRLNYTPEEKVKKGKEGDVTIFFRKGGKPLCYINTQGIKSTVTVVIGSSLDDKVNQSGISTWTKDKFNQTKPYHDGRWLVFELTSKQELDDVKSLLLIKRKI